MCFAKKLKGRRTRRASRQMWSYTLLPSLVLIHCSRTETDGKRGKSARQDSGTRCKLDALFLFSSFFYSEGLLHAFEGKPQTGFKLQTKVTCTECRWVVFHAVRRLRKACHSRLLRQPWLIIFMRVLIWKHSRRP